jgi:hypothetical protein
MSDINTVDQYPTKFKNEISIRIAKSTKSLTLLRGARTISAHTRTIYWVPGSHILTVRQVKQARFERDLIRYSFTTSLKVVSDVNFSFT